MTEQDQIFYTEEDKETEEQLWQRKKDARSHPTNQIPDISLEKLSAHSGASSQMTTLQMLSNSTTMARWLDSTTMGSWSGRRLTN